MKDIFEDIMDKLSDTAESVTKKAEEVMEAQKIKSKMRAIERNNRRDLRDLGVMIYEKYKNEEMVDSEFLELCEAIEEREAELAKCESELESIQED